ncbi:PREDICTED: putative Dol-P-Glc:Glc(2)Man(9)GlcNAc(2)-PP-Dol alpha-1,2-glucosyltransferase [Papilio polytes]|uniref:putative Dol-P-Glc:Glc(2)Man(9)GlcNAc(2)-PP-Dol alpha-1,2-glucosyltransferase n=1 Tax=Papilio polytes TaxID=76194 RepID=UPI000676A994|nr:PREDICTED: putative Dol-P-Glc:Glc(2)Man(9)GlcNAc(2)-PP-Dol alpha-1,2-glucosyltransferase [Papilio polytes]
MEYLKYYTLLGILLMSYYAASKLIFDKVFTTIPIVIDELYHLPQGMLYCEENFTYWDPKITTLPGLYLISTVISPFSCTTYNLRYVNLIASCINLLLFSSLLQHIYGNSSNPLKILLQAVNLTILPPLYFFSHVYYTDTLSMMFLLAYTRFCIGNSNKFLILTFGLSCVLMRQTNIAWIFMIFLHRNIDVFIKSSRVYGNIFLNMLTLRKNSLLAQETDRTKLKRYYNLNDFYIAVKYHLFTYMSTFFKLLTLSDFFFIGTQFILLLLFIIFVIINNGIVLGDKTAHQAVIHVPQIFYFLLFYGVFGLPYVLGKLKSTLKMLYYNKLLVFLFGLLIALIVHYNTLVHPYLLADNRHYTFYIWNRWFGKYSFAIYSTIPVYIFLIYSLYDNLKDQNCISFLIPYCVCTFAVLALQKMIEIRYFLVPYIILRLRFIRPSYKIVLMEFFWYLMMNIVTFYVFFTKEIYWKDFDYAQRIIW